MPAFRRDAVDDKRQRNAGRHRGGVGLLIEPSFGIVRASLLTSRVLLPIFSHGLKIRAFVHAVLS